MPSEHEPASQRVTFQDSPNTDIFPQHTPYIPQHFPNTFSGNPGVLWDKPGPPSIKKVPHRSGFGTIRDLSGLIQNGEGVLSVEFQIGLLETTWDELST